jgi:DNA-binding NarL/FixJ family response regulator
MSGKEKIKIFLVDDDAVLLKALEIDFLHHVEPNNLEFIVETYPTGEKCIEHLSHHPDVIILDYHLDGIEKNAMNGMETLDKIKAFNKDIPVIMLSSQDKIDVAINCMHHKASDYVIKSETAFLRLQKIITTIFLHQKMQKELSWYMDKM